jgi:hypothetical protein
MPGNDLSPRILPSNSTDRLSFTAHPRGQSRSCRGGLAPQPPPTSRLLLRNHPLSGPRRSASGSPAQGLAAGARPLHLAHLPHELPQEAHPGSVEGAAGPTRGRLCSAARLSVHSLRPSRGRRSSLPGAADPGRARRPAAVPVATPRQDSLHQAGIQQIQKAPSRTSTAHSQVTRLGSSPPNQATPATG